MNRIFYDCIDKFLVVYLNDALVFSKSEVEHIKHLEKVLSRFREHKLYVSPKKCNFMRYEMGFLWLIVDKDGIRVDPSKVDVIISWLRPEKLTDLRSLLGLIQVFRRFIKNFSGIAAPFTNLTEKDRGIHKWKFI